MSIQFALYIFIEQLADLITEIIRLTRTGLLIKMALISDVHALGRNILQENSVNPQVFESLVLTEIWEK